MCVCGGGEGSVAQQVVQGQVAGVEEIADPHVLVGVEQVVVLEQRGGQAEERQVRGRRVLVLRLQKEAGEWRVDGGQVGDSDCWR